MSKPDLPTFLLWVAESYEAMAAASDHHEEAEALMGSGQMARDHLAAYPSAILAAKAEEREACALLLDEGFEREGVKHKNDECSHGRFGYEDCEQCASAAIRKRGEG